MDKVVKMKVAIYARVSDDKKKPDGERFQDIERQLEILREHLKAKGMKKGEWKEYIDDNKSAYTDDWNSRPSFKQLINDCRRHFIQEIYIEDMTRFSRFISFALPLLQELGDLNIQLVSLREGELEVTSSAGWLKSSFLLMFAEWDSRVRAEKIRSGMQKARNLGKKIGGFRRKKDKKHKRQQEGMLHTPPIPLNNEELKLVEKVNLK